jgi:hypothetical protein
VSGSSTQPTTFTASAWISNACPFPWDFTSFPVMLTEQPAVSFTTSSA